MWHLGTRFSGGPASAGPAVGLNDLKGLSQAEQCFSLNNASAEQWFSWDSQLSVLDYLPLFSLLLDVMVVKTILLITEVLTDGTLGKVHVRGKVEEGRSKAMTQLLTSSTCMNRYIYGWRLCTETYFPYPLRQGNESFKLYSNCFTIPFTACVCVCAYIYMYVFFVHYHVWKERLVISCNKVYNYKWKFSNYIDSFTLHFIFKVTTCRIVTQSFKLKINSCTIIL